MAPPVEPEPEIVHAPHAPLAEYYDGEAERLKFVRRAFDETAVDYDRIERVMAWGSGRWYRRRALVRSGLARGMRVLDVATGTGLVAREAAAIAGDPHLVVGVDPSAGMLRAGSMPEGLVVVQGAGEGLPFRTSSFDFLSMGFALRHLTDLEVVFAEFFRVLKPGATVCILEITRPEGRLTRGLLKTYMHGIIPFAARVVGTRRETATIYRYYWDTIEACVPPASVLGALRHAGFADVKRFVELGIFSEYTGRKPEGRVGNA